MKSDLGAKQENCCAGCGQLGRLIDYVTPYLDLCDQSYLTVTLCTAFDVHRRRVVERLWNFFFYGRNLPCTEKPIGSYLIFFCINK